MGWRLGGEECKQLGLVEKWDVGSGQAQGSTQMGQRSGVCTEQVGTFTVDSSGNPPACKDERANTIQPV